jgi:hypothetical protein
VDEGEQVAARTARVGQDDTENGIDGDGGINGVSPGFKDLDACP